MKSYASKFFAVVGIVEPAIVPIARSEAFGTPTVADGGLGAPRIARPRISTTTGRTGSIAGRASVFRRTKFFAAELLINPKVSIPPTYTRPAVEPVLGLSPFFLEVRQ